MAVSSRKWRYVCKLIISTGGDGTSAHEQTFMRMLTGVGVGTSKEFVVRAHLVEADKDIILNSSNFE